MYAYTHIYIAISRSKDTSDFVSINKSIKKSDDKNKKGFLLNNTINTTNNNNTK